MILKDLLEKSEKEFEEKYGAFELCEIVNHKDHERLKSFLRTHQIAAYEAGLEWALEEINKYI